MRRTLSTRENAAAAKRRRLVRLSAILALVFLLLGLAAVSLVGWVGTYLVPVLLIIGVVAGSFALLVWVAGQLDDRWYTLP